MKKQEVVLIMILMIIIVGSGYSQEFPVGVFVNSADDSTYTRSNNYYQIKEMGVNTILQYAKPSNKDSLSMFSRIIATNMDREEDIIHHYASGYYTRWEAEEETVGNIPGIKHETGHRNGGEWRGIVGNDEAGKYLIDGPDYVQDRNYRLHYLPYYKKPIDYKVTFRLKATPPFVYGMGGDPPAEGTNICEISVVYKLQEGEDTTLVSRILTSDTLTYNYQDYTLEYNIPEKIGGKEVTKYKPEFTPIDKPGYPDKSGEEEYGVKFRVKWYGNYNLYCDYVEVYDRDIWGEYFDESGIISNLIKGYAQNFNNWANLRYWYSLDEPQTIDNYEPYRVIDSLINSVGDTLITAFYPHWDGNRNHEYSLKRFIDKTNLSKLMVDYYPLWYDQTFNYGLQTQRETIQKLFDDPEIDSLKVNDYWFVAQAMGFYARDSLGVLDTTWSKPRITPEQMRASVFLALSQGAKGIMFWNYYSYNHLGYRRCYGIVDTMTSGNYPKTDLYYEIKNNIAPRLNNKLGNSLLKLNYTGNFVHETKSVEGINSDVSIDRIDWLDASHSANKVDYHIGEFTDPNQIIPKYFYAVNLLTDSNVNVLFSVSGLNQSYTNYNVKNIEGGLKQSFTENYSFSDVLGMGDGSLFMVAPVIIYGGELIEDETISQATILEDTLFIETGVKLRIDENYTITENIYVADGGFVEIGEDGNLIRTGGADLFFNSWDQSLILAEASRNPKLIWGRHPNFSASQYRIYRAISMTPPGNPLSLDYILIGTVSSSVYEFIDYDVLLGNWDYLYYYVSAFNESSQQESGISNIIETRGGLYKEKTDEQVTTEFVLYQNSPNPFNSSTRIKYAIPTTINSAENVKLIVYDILGREIEVLVDEQKSAGEYELYFDASNLTSGMYLLKLEAVGKTFIRKIILVK